MEPRLKRVDPTAASLVNYIAHKRSLSPYLSLSLSFSPLLPLPFTKRISFDLQTRDFFFCFFFFSFCSSLPKGLYLHPPILLTRSSRTPRSQVPALQLRRNGGPARFKGSVDIEKEKKNQSSLPFFNFVGSIGGEFVAAATSRRCVLVVFVFTQVLHLF